jgi:hypothetical protein
MSKSKHPSKRMAKNSRTRPTQPKTTRSQHGLDQLPARAEVVAELHRLNDEALSGALPIGEIVDGIFELMQRPKGHIELIERWVPQAPGHEEELIGLLFLLWNLTPQPDEGGKTLLETLAEEQAQESVADRQAMNEYEAGSGWAGVVPLLEHIKQTFQEPFLVANEAMPKRKRDAALNGLPVLFFRFWHTVCPQLEGWPPILGMEYQQERGLEIPEGQHVAMRMYRNPEMSDDPEHNVRTVYGLEDDNFLPLTRDYRQAAQGYESQIFWTDPEYRRWLKRYLICS